MIRVRLGPRLIKAARKLTPDLLQEANATISAVQAQFGQPHLYSGQGLRKLGRNSYEARLGLHLRIVVAFDDGELIAYDIMDYYQVRQWLKNRKGN